MLPGNVLYEGVLDRSEISQVLLKSDLMLLVSSHKGEGYAGAIIEAIQTQTPMILSDIRPFREIMSEEQAIFLSAGDTARLNTELIKLRNDREVLKELSSKLAEIRNDFDSEVILRRLHKEHCACVD
jgi:glycosyltransferase involved in cell wall biosynthesis